MAIRKTLTTIFLLSVLGVSIVGAAETRSHFVVMRGHRVPVYTATLITNVTEHETSRTLLMENVYGERFVFSNLRSFSDQTDVYTVESPVNNVLFSTSIHFPLRARTMGETMTELREIQKRRTQLDLPIELRTKKSVQWAKENDLRDPAAATNLRQNLRRELAPGFIGELARMKGLFSVPELSDFCSFVGLLQEGSCARDNNLRVARTAPDCGFDAGFGRECSAAQLELAATLRATVSVGNY